MLRGSGRRVGPIQAITSRLGWGQFRLADPPVTRHAQASCLRPVLDPSCGLDLPGSACDVKQRHDGAGESDETGLHQWISFWFDDDCECPGGAEVFGSDLPGGSDETGLHQWISFWFDDDCECWRSRGLWFRPSRRRRRRKTATRWCWRKRRVGSSWGEPPFFHE